MHERAPIAVFDSGVGSYSVVKKLREELPHESIVYLADRAEFPYGEKTREELKSVVEKTILWLEENFEPKLIIVASNTPSLQVLDSVHSKHNTPLLGVFPPLREAEEKSETQQIAVLATRGAVRSSEIDSFVEKQDLLPGTSVHKVDASGMVALVEPGTFLYDKEKTEAGIRTALEPVFAEHPDIDVMTLSSTHLPFLLEYLETLYPHIVFLDPASSVAEEARSIILGNGALREGNGSVRVLTTEDEAGKFKAEDLKKILALLGLETEVEAVVLDSSSGWYIRQS